MRLAHLASSGGDIDPGVICVGVADDREVEPPAADDRVGQAEAAHLQIGVEPETGERTARLGVAAPKIAAQFEAFGIEEAGGANLAEHFLAVESVEKNRLELATGAGDGVGLPYQQGLMRSYLARAAVIVLELRRNRGALHFRDQLDRAGLGR